jgi:D-3-phosphoglycerate dehydrogenase
MTAAGIAALEEGLCEYEHKKLSEEEVLAGGYGDYDAVVIRSATKVREAGIRAAVAKEGCKLKIIGRAGVGTDNVDSHIATDCGVMVMNAPLAATRSVAELALGHLFVAVRKICFADREMHAGAWPKKQCGGTELYGKKLGVVGYGRIGQATGLLAQAVGMEIHAYDPFMNREFAKANGTVVHETIESLFKACTHITVHTPLIKGVTENLIGKKLFDMMPGPKNFIVSVARGGVVDETAVLEALESGKLTAAGLDVFAKEPMVADHPLLKHPGFHCTPHIGANTAEGQDRCGKEMAETVVAALKGDVHMDHLVNRGVVPRS